MHTIQLTDYIASHCLVQPTGQNWRLVCSFAAQQQMAWWKLYAACLVAISDTASAKIGHPTGFKHLMVVVCSPEMMTQEASKVKAVFQTRHTQTWTGQVHQPCHVTASGVFNGGTRVTGLRSIHTSSPYLCIVILLRTPNFVSLNARVKTTVSAVRTLLSLQGDCALCFQCYAYKQSNTCMRLHSARLLGTGASTASGIRFTGMHASLTSLSSPSPTGVQLLTFPCTGGCCLSPCLSSSILSLLTLVSHALAAVPGLGYFTIIGNTPTYAAAAIHVPGTDNYLLASK